MAIIDDLFHLFQPALRSAKRHGGSIDARYDENGDVVITVGGRRTKDVDTVVRYCGARPTVRLLEKAGVPVRRTAYVATEDEPDEDTSEFERHLSPDLYQTAGLNFGKRRK